MTRPQWEAAGIARRLGCRDLRELLERRTAERRQELRAEDDRRAADRRMRDNAAVAGWIDSFDAARGAR